MLDDLRRQTLEALRPPVRLPLSTWIERNLRLPEGVAAVPGPVRLYPFQRDIADAIGNPEIERVTILKSVRVGLTTLMTGAIASYCVNEPAPILLLLPTEADCRDYTVSDLEPIFDASPALRGVISEEADEAGRNTLTSRRFPGGSLKIVASRSPRNLRRHNARVLVIDEADAMEIGAEGSPIALAERRTLSFPNRKIVMGSTPTLAETSHVCRAWEASDQRIFEVPCPSCGAFNEIQWGNIEWEPDKPETAAFRCPSCGDLVPERHKARMVEQGRWRALQGPAKGHVGFRINALVSLLPNAAWGKLAAEFLAARKDPASLQVFTNTILAQPWRETVDDVNELDLAGRVEPFDLNRIPPEVLAITAGLDVQDDRIEATFLGWTADNQILVLDHAVIWGSPGDDPTWFEIDALLRSTWEHPFGGRLTVDAAVIDSGDGDWTGRVYAFAFARAGRRIFAGKGLSGSRPALQLSRSKGLAGRLALVGVDGVKAQILDRLTRGKSIRFAGHLETHYFEQLCSERRVIRYRRGQPVRQWERIPGRRAEALDCLVYGIAARSLVSFNPVERKDQLSNAPVSRPPPRTIRSSWMER